MADLMTITRGQYAEDIADAEKRGAVKIADVTIVWVAPPAGEVAA